MKHLRKNSTQITEFIFIHVIRNGIKNEDFNRT
jgi:hypothetical protein